MFRPRARAIAFGLALWGVTSGPAPVAALDLPEALRQAAAANPGLAARAAMVDAARHRVAPAGAWAAPMLELGVVNVPTNGAFNLDPMTMKMVGLSQRVPVFRSNRLARRAAREAVARETADAELMRYEVLGMTWETYADARHAGELAALAEAHVGVMDRLVLSARARFESGNGRLEDLLRSQAERASTQRDAAMFRAEALAAHARLDALRGLPAGTDADTLAPLPETPDTAAVLWRTAVGPTHPRLEAMEAEASRYRFSARAARRMAWPDLELRASYGVRERLYQPAHGTTTDQDNMFSASVGFMLPIFAGARGAEGAEMDAMARVSEAERRGAELELLREVESAHAAAAAARQSVRLIADTLIPVQSRAVEASWSSYRAGVTDLWRVFESTHALYDQASALIRLRHDLARAQARLISLTGRADLLGITLPDTGGPR